MVLKEVKRTRLFYSQRPLCPWRCGVVTLCVLLVPFFSPSDVVVVSTTQAHLLSTSTQAGKQHSSTSVAVLCSTFLAHDDVSHLLTFSIDKARLTCQSPFHFPASMFEHGFPVHFNHFNLPKTGVVISILRKRCSLE